MNTLTVSQVNRYIKAILDEAQPLNRIYVSGEISNFKHYRQSGHMYFTLKDNSSQLKCVMFAGNNSSLKFTPEDGMSVVCFGKVSAYERDGQYQLYVSSMQPNGLGALALAYEQLKQRLEKDGYFAPEHKKSVPKYPVKIGVATSNMGAAVEDIKNIISRRFPLAEIVICPTVVQGGEACEDIASSVKFLDTLGVDVIIVGRGGGSMEDLWAFNTMPVIQAVYDCNTPIISAVGHETDFTLCDFVADLRAPTPSAAAELAVPDINSELQIADGFYSSLLSLFKHKIETEEINLDRIVNRSPLSDVNEAFKARQEKLDLLCDNLMLRFKAKIDDKQKALKREADMLNAVNPLSVIARGFTLTSKDNKTVSSVKSLSVNDTVCTRFSDGKITATVCEVISNE